ncbi:hypothetical protein Pcinc_036518 [Petrolisthes cinctipes]|uniref:ETS domain-containing protein n=1 Tax=Petrolisthes cinctipes TaxID=88211 RepID=A0AAE1BXP4_PETCI|nr:hypothetical protein Pcinc_036518 [Petrolisthes cinctipes]
MDQEVLPEDLENLQIDQNQQLSPTTVMTEGGVALSPSLSYHVCPLNHWRKEHVLAWLWDVSKEQNISAGNLLSFVECSGAQLLQLPLDKFVALNPHHGELFFSRLCSYVQYRSRQNGYHQHHLHLQRQQQQQQQQHQQEQQQQQPQQQPTEFVNNDSGATYYQLQPRSIQQYHNTPQHGQHHHHHHHHYQHHPSWAENRGSYPTHQPYFSEAATPPLQPGYSPPSPSGASCHSPYHMPPTPDSLSHTQDSVYSSVHTFRQATFSPNHHSFPPTLSSFSPPSAGSCSEGSYSGSMEVYTHPHPEYKPSIACETDSSCTHHFQLCPLPDISPPLSSSAHLHTTDDQLCIQDGQKKIKNRGERGPKLWEFLLDLLEDPGCNPAIIRWENEEERTFRLTSPHKVALRWGQRRPKESQLPYDYFARALRYHYNTGMLISVPERKLVYKFGPKAIPTRRGEGVGAVGACGGSRTPCTSPPCNQFDHSGRLTFS